MRQIGINIKNIRCDNVGENKKLEENILKANLNTNFEYTAVKTPQQTSICNLILDSKGHDV